MKTNYCPTCRLNVQGVNPPVNHIAHAILSLLTGGLWLFVWLLMIVNAACKPKVCKQCGTATTNHPLPVPDDVAKTFIAGENIERGAMVYIGMDERIYSSVTPSGGIRS